MMGLVYPNGMDYVCLFTPDGRATGTPLRLLGDDPVKICLDRQGVCVYNKRNFTEGDEGEANYGSFQRTAGWCEAAGL